MPTVQKDGKVIAHHDVNYNGKNTDNNKVQCIINSMIKQNLINFIDI
ncbi:cell cycle protein MesJ-like protein [Wolbachia endosymbiont of Armadillidium vulgare str. wVulC]|nr:cell cycle protein MesJ-like protein [Wolbachia endosymbiont of Armadillidium vulgare str. wVulC]